jgi:hypothetical protein
LLEWDPGECDDGREERERRGRGGGDPGSASGARRAIARISVFPSEARIGGAAGEKSPEAVVGRPRIRRARARIQGAAGEDDQRECFPRLS